MAFSMLNRGPRQSLTPTGFIRLDYDPRYFVDTAKDNIATLPQVFGELLSNCDEAMRDHPTGTIDVDYQPTTGALMVRDDGCGMSAKVIVERLVRVGGPPQEGSQRGFFARGGREVFTALEGACVQSIVLVDGEYLYSKAVFRDGGMDLVCADEPVMPAIREETGIAVTGTRIDTNLSPLLRNRPRPPAFSEVLAKLADCVQLRVLLQDPAREVWLKYASAPRRRVQFRAPADHILVPERRVEAAGLVGTLVVYRSEKPIPLQAPDVQRHGIMVRGERAAYQMTEGAAVRGHAGWRHIYGELRLDGIEPYQRAHLDELVYKVNRTGLNPEHPITIAAMDLVDRVVGPHLSSLEPRQARAVSRDVQRRILKMIGGLNKALKGLGGSGKGAGTSGTGAGAAARVESVIADGVPPRAMASSDPADAAVEVGPRLWMEPRSLIVKPLGQRVVSVMADARRVRAGAAVSVEVLGEGVNVEVLGEGVIDKVLSPAAPCPSGRRGRLVALLMVEAGAEEGRSEVRVRVDAEEALLPVHVREERASGLISRVVFDDDDNEEAAVTIDTATGVACVFVGRPEFASIRSVRRLKPEAALEDPVYAAMMASCLSEAAVSIQAKRATELSIDDMSPAQRRDVGLLMETYERHYQEGLYRVRAAAIVSSVADASR